jgi:signal transduction histidine kinase
MRPFASLRNRIFVASALVAVVTTVVALHFIAGRVSSAARRGLARGLDRAASLVEENHAARLETLTLLARLIADLPKLKAAASTADPPTVGPVALDYQRRVRSDLFLVQGRGGQVLASLGASLSTVGRLAAARRAARGADAVTLETEGGVLEVVTVPIALGPDPPEEVGSLSLGFALDDALAAQFKAKTDSEVVFTLAGRVRAKTLRDLRAEDLVRVLATDSVVDVEIGGREYAARRQRLSAASSTEPVAVILRSHDERLRLMQTLRAGFAVAAIVAVLVAVLLSYAVARTVTTPLSALTATMREISATGDLARRLRPPRTWDDEDARLLAQTFDSLTEAIARFQREVSQRERLTALGRLSTVIAHEVRNPLMIIKAALRTIQTDGAVSEEVAEAVSDIDHEVGRLNHIVDDVLDFARPIRLERGPTDVNALLAEVVDAASARVGSRAVKACLDDGLERAVVDGDRLRTALLNIITNALDAVAAAGDGDERPVEVRSRALPGGGVAIEVEDRGVGIEGVNLPHVFEPYFTTKRTGTGLGLAIAKNVIESHGGTITASAGPEGGTRVRIELPAAGGEVS